MVIGSASSASSTAHAALVGVLVFATAVWVGGFVALVVVARVARRTLRPTDQVAFFRALGRGYNLVGIPALLVGFATGAVLLVGKPWTGTLVAALAVAATLVVATVAGVIQARGITRLRRRALTEGENTTLADRVRRAARRAAWLRGSIGGLSLALIALGALLAG